MLRVQPSPFCLLLAASLAGCAVTPAAQPAPAGSSNDATASSTAPASSGSAAAGAPSSSSGAPTRAECDVFMDVVARTTVLRASIQRDTPDAVKAADWATRASELAAQAKALHLQQEDLVIESANLATRLSDLTRDLRALADVEKSRDLSKRALAYKVVLATSEQVEVLTREPAARCAGDTKLLKPQAGKLRASQIQDVIRDRFGDFTACYAQALKRDPTLRGRVLVRFVIGVDGHVTDAGDGSSVPVPPDAVVPPSDPKVPALTDKKTIDCVIAAARTLVFPKPDGGTVTVFYPLVLSSK